MIEELASKLLESIKLQLTPDKFEMLIRWYFQKTGATRAFRPGKNSSDKWNGADADIVAEFEPLKVLFYVQAKLHVDVTSSWAVEQVRMYKEQHEDSAAFCGAQWPLVRWPVATKRR